jgi:hypothetical protein
VLAELARTRLRAKRGLLEEAFVGRFGDHHAFLLKTMLARVDQASADIADLDRKIEAELPGARAPRQRGKWSSWTGLALRFSLWPSPPRWNAVGPRRPCPPRARSIGNWRSPTDNYGRSQEGLTCELGIASGRMIGPARAFQARDRWGHIGATFGPRMTGPQRTTPVTSGAACPQLTGQARLGPHVTSTARRSLTRKRSQVRTLSRSPGGGNQRRPERSLVRGFSFRIELPGSSSD